MAAASALDCPRTFGVDIDLLIFAAFEPAGSPRFFPGDGGFIEFGESIRSWSNG